MDRQTTLIIDMQTTQRTASAAYVPIGNNNGGNYSLSLSTACFHIRLHASPAKARKHLNKCKTLTNTTSQHPPQLICTYFCTFVQAERSTLVNENSMRTFGKDGRIYRHTTKRHWKSKCLSKQSDLIMRYVSQMFARICVCEVRKKCMKKKT